MHIYASIVVSGRVRSFFVYMHVRGALTKIYSNRSVDQSSEGGRGGYKFGSNQPKEMAEVLYPLNSMWLVPNELSLLIWFLKTHINLKSSTLLHHNHKCLCQIIAFSLDNMFWKWTKNLQQFDQLKGRGQVFSWLINQTIAVNFSDCFPKYVSYYL